jgi:hypothetical protein
LSQLEGELDQLEATLAQALEQGRPLSWHEVMDPLHRLGERLRWSWGVVSHLNGVCNSPELRAAHASQQAWLDATQGMNSYLDAGDEAARAIGLMSGRFECAEGWRRHLHLGLSSQDDDPLTVALGPSLTCG